MTKAKRNIGKEILTGLQELRRGERGRVTVMPDVAQIREAARRGAALSRQLLTFSRREVRESELLHVDEIVSSLENMLNRLLGADV